MTRLNGFNRIAPLYDGIKRLVFFSSIRKSKTHFLSRVPSTGDVLILGGGSGEILNPLLETCPAVRVWYIDASSSMLDLARGGLSQHQVDQVIFIHGTQNSIPSGAQFSAVITQFYLDLFPDEDLRAICDTLNTHLAKGGVWLASDFVDGGKAWQRLLLAAMYRFFIAASNITAMKLPAWELCLDACGLSRLARATFYRGFIISSVYKKAGDI